MKFKLMAGEMAKLRKISKQTLIHYDKIGLFQPCETDPETGYRYYSLEQLTELDVIICLKGLGLSLKEIKTYMQIHTTPERIKALEDQNEVLEKELNRIQQAKHRLEDLIATHKKSLTITPFDMGITWREEIPIISRPVPSPNDPYALEVAFIDFLEIAEEKYNATISDVLVFVDEKAPSGNNLMKIGLLNKEPAEEYLPQGHYAYIYHEGSFEKAPESSRTLMDHMAQRGYVPKGPTITRLLKSALLAVTDSEFILELNILVEKKDP